MDNTSTKLMMEVSESDIVTLQLYAGFLNQDGHVFYNWRSAFNHLLAGARIEMGSAPPATAEPEELDLGAPS